MAEHKKKAQSQKRGEPGSKEAEVILLQEAMEERNTRNVRHFAILLSSRRALYVHVQHLLYMIIKYADMHWDDM